MSMRCNDTRELIGAYIDGELDLVRSLDIEGHLHECSICSREYENHRSLHRAIRDGELYFDAPRGLEKRIRNSLGSATRSEAKNWFLPRSWVMVGAPIAATLILILVATLILKGPGSNSLLAQDLVYSHIRSLQEGHLTDVPSTDQHNVKPWFNGKVDFSPPVRDLTDAGFNLIGGRLDYADDRAVAVVVYGRRQHKINLYCWPSKAEGNTGAASITRNGYNMIHWIRDGMNFWAVSDLNSGELHDFVKAQQE
jgi:anti-sigma factor RsiW